MRTLIGRCDRFLVSIFGFPPREGRLAGFKDPCAWRNYLQYTIPDAQFNVGTVIIFQERRDSVVLASPPSEFMRKSITFRLPNHLFNEPRYSLSSFIGRPGPKIYSLWHGAWT
jgi:hypothetical protein